MMSTESAEKDLDPQEMKEKLEEFQEENKLLHTQAKLLHEELDKYYQRFQRYQAEEAARGKPDAKMAEKIRELDNQTARLQAKENALKKLLEKVQGLPALLASGRSRPGFLKLIKSGGYINRPTASLGGGGGNYSLLISAYKKGGLAAVIHLLNSEPVTPKVWANALTELAKDLRKTDIKTCADLAFLAWQLDPLPYRLKWYAFRLHDAGETILADAIIDLFPDNMEIKEQEKERIKRIRKEAKHHYLENTSLNSHLPLYMKMLEEATKRIEHLIFENAALKASYTEKEAANRDEIERYETENIILRHSLEAKEEEGKDERDGLLEENATLRAHLAASQKELNWRIENLQEQLALAETRLKAVQSDLNRERETGKKAYLEQTINLLDKNYNDISAKLENQNASIAKNIEEKLAKIQHPDLTLAEELEKKLNNFASLNKREMRNLMFQNNAFNGLKQYFQGDGLPDLDMWSDDWAASPDFVLNLVRTLEKNDYDLIIEFGSGYTTLFTARSISQKAARKNQSKIPAIVSFEHQENFCNQTRKLLEASGLENLVDLNHARLLEWYSPNGEKYNYYDCDPILGKYSDTYKNSDSRILVIVDGPPGGTCKNARFPAFPFVMRHFAPANIDFIIDDYKRQDEREILGEWQKVCETGGIPYQKQDIEFNKGACAFSVNKI